jgi:steroid delta-isomerase
MNELVEKAVAAYFAALRDMNVEAWVSTFAEDGVSHDPVGAPPHQGHAAIRAFLTGVLALFENVGLQEQSVFIAGNEAAVKWIGYGRGKNERDVRFEGIDVLSVNELGKIISVRAYWDPGPVITQVTE